MTLATLPELAVLLRDAHLTYPHANAFVGEDQLVVAAHDADRTRLILLDVNTGDARPVAEFPGSRKVIWFDVARDAPVAVVAVNGILWKLDLARGGAPEAVHFAATGMRLGELPSVNADGTEGLFQEHDGRTYRVYRICLRTGRREPLFEHDWWINHLHYCPADESWIGYCHEGKTETVPDRVWAWHATHAPRGRCVLDQRTADPTKPLCVGHERWAHHAPVVYAVAFDVSPGRPTGLYEAATDGTTRLVSAGDHDWHCDVSRDGRYAVIDTINDGPGCGITLIDLATGSRQELLRTGVHSHPHHPHPIFSPDGSRIFFNHTTEGPRGAVAAIALDDVPR